MAQTPKKFLDADGLTYFASLLNEYPTNSVLQSVIDAIDNIKVDRTDLANVALTGSYNDLTNKPIISGSTVIESYDTTGTPIANIGGTEIYIEDATESSPGLMSASDKELLNNLHPNIRTTLSDINMSEFEIINAKAENVLDMTLTAEPIIESQIRTSNLLNINNTFGNYYIGSNGAINASLPDILGDFIPVNPGDDIYYTGHVGETTASSVNRRLHVYTADKTWIKQISFAGSLRIGQDWSTHGVVPSNGAYVRVSWGTTDTNLMITVGAPIKYWPYYITPFDKITSVSFKVGTTADSNQATTYTLNVPASAGDQYGFSYNPIEGILYSSTGHIDSYNGETLPGQWWSDRDEYVEGATPSIGAEVIYKLNDEDIEEYEFDNSLTVLLNNHINFFFVENGVLKELAYYAETLAVDHLTIYTGLTYGSTNVLENDIIEWKRAANLIDNKANIDSPAFTGMATAPTLGVTSNSNRIATTAFVQQQMHNLAPYETNAKASRNYNIGDYLTYAGYLYKVIAAIPINTNLVVGTNIEVTDIATELNLLRSLISS